MPTEPGTVSPPTAEHVAEVPPEARFAAREKDTAAWVTARRPRLSDVALRLARFPVLVVEHRDLVLTSVRRELEARFQGTVLKWVWPLVHPLFLFIVYYFIFTKLLNFKIPNLPPGQESAMGVYMFCGIIVWTAVAETITRGTNVIIENGNLIKKMAFPSEVMPLQLTLVAQITLLFAVTVFAVACLLTPIWTAPGIELLWIPVLVVVQTLFLFGIALFLGTLQVFLRDTLQVVTVLVTIWMFVTPIFWIPSPVIMGEAMVPYLPFIHANPIYHLVQAWRGALMGDLAVPWPELAEPIGLVSTAAIPGHLATFTVWAVALFVLGYAFFVISQRRFADEV